MKNLAIAVSLLALLIILVFIFASKEKVGGDILIPTPTPIPSPQLEFIQPRVSTSSSARKLYSQVPPVLPKEQINGKKVRIKTDMGDIVFELNEEAPVASSNFIFLTNEKFYDGLMFHRREENFVIQGGDPRGDGTGGPGYTFADEPVTGEYTRGTVAMANAGPNTNGSQFFILLVDALNLSKNYTIFGKVVEGIGVAGQIQSGNVMNKVTIE